MSTVKARVENLLKEAKDYDPDKRFMAANDLCAELLKDQEAIEASLVKQICAVFLTQLDDQSTDVQGNAVRSIKKIITKLQDSQVSEVINKLGDCLKTGKEEFRDIYATCLKGLIADVSDTSALIVCSTMLPILHQCITCKNESVSEEALEILTDLNRKFPGTLHSNTDRTDLVSGVMSLLLSNKSSIRKKATNCIGALSLILPQSQLQSLVSSIIQTISKRGQKKDIYSYVQALGSISKNVGEKLSSNLRVLFDILLSFCDTSSLDLDSAAIETDYELIETCLNSVESLIRRCAKDILEYSGRIINLVLGLASYDPNFIQSDQMQSDDDDWGSDDDSDYGNPADDSSWKIRRAALNVLDAIVKSRPEIVGTYYTAIVNALVRGFRDREENVKLDVFRTFSTLIKSVMIGNEENLHGEDLPVLIRTRSSADVFQDLLPSIVQEVGKELKEKSIRTRQAVTHFTVDLSLTFPTSIIENLEVIKDGLIRNLEDQANANLRISTLVICRRLFRSHHARNSELAYLISDQISKAINDTYYKVTTEALKLVGSIVKSLPAELKFIQAVFPLVLHKLTFTDIDQEVKQASIYSTSIILSVCHSSLNPSDVVRAIDLITERLKNEVTRISCLKAWVKLSQSPTCPPVQSSTLRSLCDELQNLLKKALRSLKLSTLETIISVSKAFALPETSYNLILQELPVLISENDLNLAQGALNIVDIFVSKGVNVSPEALNNLLKSMNTLAVSSLIQGATLTSLSAAYRSVIKHLAYPVERLVQDFRLNLNPARKALEITAQCTAVVTLAAGKSYLDSAIQEFRRSLGNQTDVCCFSVLCLGQIGLHHDLSAQRGLGDEITELFNRKSEDIKICASLAFGQVAVGNLQVFLPVIFEKFSSEEHRYLLLNSIEEVISHKSEHMAPYIGQILPVIFENAERADENVRNISAECLGKLVSVSPDSLIQSILSKIHSGSVFAKITMVSSVKYIVHQKVQNYSDYMEQVLPILVETLSIPDAHLKRACLVSINTIAHISPSSLKHNFIPLCEKIFLETVIKPELIRKVDLGAFTHITDDGLPIRKAAFSALETIIDNLPERIEANKVLDHVINGLDDNSDEVQMLCHQLLSKLIHWASGAVAGNLNTIVAHIRKNVEKNLKLLSQKQEVERANDLLRSALRCVEKIETLIETENSAPFRDFMSYVAGVADLNSILNTIKSQKESLFFI